MRNLYHSLFLSGLAALTLYLTGCAATGPTMFRKPVDPNYCGPEPGSDEWWELQSELPPGARQKYKKGKLWPPYPRPTGPKQQLSHRYHTAHYWPHPYICQDRAIVHEHINIQKSNGWMEATTLYEYHFNPETDELTNPGRSHLQWILQNTPPEYRMVFVQTGDSPEQSENRLTSVRTAAANVVSNDGLPPIQLKVTQPYGRPAQEVDLINRAVITTLPAPRVSPPILGGTAGPTGN